VRPFRNLGSHHEIQEKASPSHNSSSSQSINALSLLRSALSGPYPPGDPNGQPLQFNLSVVEAPPTADQLKTIISYLPSPATNPSMALLSVHPSVSATDRTTTLKDIAALAEKNPKALKWPIVVNWNDGKASIGDGEGVKDILETLRKTRDGELKDGVADQPKGWFS
jgi:arsenate reductase-like glutaredoxin family protein